MRNYQILTMELLPGETPKEKFDSLGKLLNSEKLLNELLPLITETNVAFAKMQKPLKDYVDNFKKD